MHDVPERPVMVEYPDGGPGALRRWWRGLDRWQRLGRVLLVVVILGVPLAMMLSQARWWGEPLEQAVVEDAGPARVDEDCDGGEQTVFRLRVVDPRPGHPADVLTQACSDRWEVGERVDLRRTAPVASGDEIRINPYGWTDLAIGVVVMAVVCFVVAPVPMGRLVWRSLVRPAGRTLRRTLSPR